MRRSYVVLGVLSGILVASVVLATYQWPLSPVSSRHNVSATLGEFRPGPPLHFHAGVDLPDTAGTPVLAVDQGEVVHHLGCGTDSTYWVGDFRYYHIVFHDSVENGDTLSAGDTVGCILSMAGPHLHFREKSTLVSPHNALNPLRDGGLNPIFTDFTQPHIDSIRFYRQASNTLLSDTLSRKVDILCVAGDTRTDTLGQAPPDTGNVSVYRIGYEVRDTLGNEKKAYWERIVFDSIATPSDTVQLKLTYGAGSSQSHFQYWVTNSPFDTVPANRNWYWNTKQDSGSADSVDADSVEEALFPRGNYWVKVQAYDIDSNSCAESVQVYIDNFGPRVGSVFPADSATGVSIGVRRQGFETNVGFSDVTLLPDPAT